MATKNPTTSTHRTKSNKTFYYAEPRHFDAMLAMYELAMRAEWSMYEHPDGLLHPDNGHRAAQQWSAAHIALESFEHESDPESVLHQASLDLQQVLFAGPAEPQHLLNASREFLSKKIAAKDTPEVAERLSQVSVMLEVHSANKELYSLMPASRKLRVS